MLCWGGEGEEPLDCLEDIKTMLLGEITSFLSGFDDSEGGGTGWGVAGVGVGVGAGVVLEC